MGKIIFCSDLVLRVSDSQLMAMAAHSGAGDGLDFDEYGDVIVPDITNVTEWLMTSTEFRPQYPDGCVVRNEMSTMGKVGVILVVWSALVVLTTFYCYYCEQRLFPKGKLKESSGMGIGGGMNGGLCCSGRIDADALMSGQTAIRSGAALEDHSDNGIMAVESPPTMHKTQSQSSLLSSSNTSPSHKRAILPPNYHSHQYSRRSSRSESNRTTAYHRI